MIQIDIHKRLHGSHGDMNLDVNLEIQKGEFVALMGESGSGKTTLLRVLAGLEKAEGDINVDEVLWLGRKKMLPPQQREIGFIFQDYALFDNMSVEENLLYVNDDKALAKRLLEMTELSRLSHRNVKGLSGGQKQRVSLCRAMMKKPKLLLMDEPLSALDPLMRSKLQDEILKLHKTFGTTTIMVSHDADDSYHLSDRILVLDQGKIVADGSPKEILVKTNKEVYTLFI
ncbi:MAG: ABC transporter ATP-binding protein [Sulfurovum sp.]|uniref:ABC transporter ATP-binding protein n=1 Tax=Sulfurovum sp. TaxID=1969726 RepID=UPI00286839FA|nr:ABC transporter ATP-binding protein [Sulfurovum sp.]MCO4844524.1 ABC transporter ATP-binding protein [Sulfurovum sp.]